MNEESFVVGADVVVREFGRWPSFHDAEVLSIVLHRSPPRIELRIHVFEYGQPAANGYLEHKHDSDLTLVFADVEDVGIEDWNEQNVLNSLQIERDDESFRVLLSGIYGVTLSCTCSSVQVMGLRTHS